MSDGSSALETPVMPFLRWVGGKRWLLHVLPDVAAPLRFANYHEPFLGGASMFMGLPVTGHAFLSDLNAELIETFSRVRDDPDRIADLLGDHENTEAHYYKTRAQVPDDPDERAARFIYLNHTSFNGIHRVNLKGDYNVPYGHRASPNIPSRNALLAASRKLAHATLEVADFSCVLHNLQKNDLVFLDPPYTIAHNHNGFVKYNQKLFSFEDQIRLSTLIDAIKKRGAYYILTNAAHESIATLFDKGDRRIETSRRNSIGGTAAQRGSAVEYLFTNLPEDD